MFSTILKEVTGYFDRHALVSAFFPSLIFWGTTIGIVLSDGHSLSELAQRWGDLAISLQAISLISFFVWVAFSTFITINYQPALLRFYEGYWSTSNVALRWIGDNRQRAYQKQWRRLVHEDAALEKIHSEQLAQRIWLIQLIESVSKPPSSAQPAIDIEAVESLMKTTVSRMEEELLLASPFVNPLPLQELNNRWQQWMEGRKAIIDESTQKRWANYERILTAYTDRLLRDLEMRIDDIEANRHRIDRERFLLFPLAQSNVLPTEFGNVMRAAELYSSSRYNLDAVTIWSRLQSVLPKEFSQSLRSSKTAVDLMVVLSAYCLLFGIPLSVWLSWQAERWFLWIVPAVCLLLSLFLRRMWISLLSGVAVCLSFWLSRMDIDAVSTSLVSLQVLLTLVSSVLLMSRLSYQNAVQAALTYGEQIKAAFDLYRWKALEAMHLKLPNNLSDEKKLWGEVGGLLYRGYGDCLRHYQFKHPKEEPLLKTSTLVDVVVAVCPLLPYQPVDLSQVELKQMEKKKVPSDAITDIQAVARQCAVSFVETNTPLCRRQLVAQSLLRDRIVTSFPVTPAITLGNSLWPGTTVVVHFKTAEGAHYAMRGVVVLEIKPVETTRDSAHSASTYSQILVAAIPKTESERRSEWVGSRVVAVSIGLLPQHLSSSTHN